MSKKKPASIYTALRIHPELREEAKRRAAEDGRTLSNYIKHLIREDLDSARVAENPPPFKRKQPRKKK